jgi:hypothetical protein
VHTPMYACTQMMFIILYENSFHLVDDLLIGNNLCTRLTSYKISSGAHHLLWKSWLQDSL